MADDDFNEDEKTLMVSIDSVPGGPLSSPGHRHGAPVPQPASRAHRHGAPAHHLGAAPDDDFEDAATQMVDISEFEQPAGGFGESTQPHREALATAPHPQVGAGAHQPFGRPSSPAAFVPDSDVAGHQGHTDFINIEELAAMGANFGPPATSRSIMDDPVLTQGYQFGPQSIQEGDVTLVFAQNPLGRAVVLRRIWSEDPNTMPDEWRQRLSQLEALKVPGLVPLNGVLASQSGVWAEMAKPEGYRLSAVLEQHGPQSVEHVSGWLKQCAEIIEAIHEAGLLYVNLTLDAIWIQEDNSIVLEPFDLLSFEARGDLGEFGPLELRRPPQDRQLSPATDVYSLAAVGTAALTGLPLTPEHLEAIDDKKLARQLRSGLANNPAERPQTMGEFAARFKAHTPGESKFNINLAELDIKVVAAIAVLLLGGFAGYMYWNKQQAEKAAAEAARLAEAQADYIPEDLAAGAPAPTEAPAAAGAPAAAQPGVVADSRLMVLTSYQINPPAESTEEAAVSPEEAAAQSAALLEKARGLIKSADKLRPGSVQLDEYRSALESVTASIRLHGNTPTDEEQQLLTELLSKKPLREYEQRQRERITTAIDKNIISDAQRAYTTLATLDYRADSTEFFRNNPGAKVRLLNNTGDQAEPQE